MHKHIQQHLFKNEISLEELLMIFSDILKCIYFTSSLFLIFFFHRYKLYAMPVTTGHTGTFVQYNIT